MTVNAITDTKNGEQGLRLLIFILPLFSLILSPVYHIRQPEMESQDAEQLGKEAPQSRASYLLRPRSREVSGVGTS